VRLTDGLIDDAGLFPPTSLDMDKALARFRSTSSPMLTGRFLVPGSRLDELSSLLSAEETEETAPIDVHVIAPLPPRFPQHQGAVDLVRVRAVEGREGTTAGEIPCYVEGVPPTELPEGCFGKVRCAGIADADLAAFIAAAARASRPFKATAGLHRAVRGWDGAGFHGYLNVLLAVAHAVSGGKAIDVVREDDAETLAREARALSDDQVTAVRWLFHSYGSCDTTQPIHDAQELGLHV
jgi:hypothetical protein